MNWAFKVIHSDMSSNQERVDVIMYNNVDLISKTYEDITSGKLQIRQFQPPHSGLMTVVWKTPKDIYNNLLLVIDLHFYCWK